MSGAQERIAKLEALLERVRSRGTKDDSPPASAAQAAAPVAAAAAPVASAAAQVVTPIPVATPIPAAPISGIPEITVGRDVVRDGLREIREDGRRISNVPASVRGTTDQELPSVIIAAPPEASAPLSVPPISSVELEADDVIEAAPAPPPRSLSRPPPAPPARSPTIPPPSTVVTPLPVRSALVPAAARAPVATIPPDTVQLSVPTPAPTPIPATRVPQPHSAHARQSENRLGDADITAGHPVSVDVDLEDEVQTPEPEEQPAPSSSRRPRSEHAELAGALEDDEASPPPHTVPPESGRQASPAPAESGKRSSVPAVRQDLAPPASLQADIATGRQAEAQVASFHGETAVQKPATFGELLDSALAL